MPVVVLGYIFNTNIFVAFAPTIYIQVEFSVSETKQKKTQKQHQQKPVVLICV